MEPSVMKQKELQTRLNEIRNRQEVEGYESSFNRARAITVGTSFGGTTEVSMRGNGDKFLYCVMQPVEVLELIHQLAANVGCHIAIKPRDDFGSWREWRVSEAEKKHLNGHAPFPNDMAVFQRLGALGFNQEEAEATVENWLSHKEYEYVNGGAQVKKELKNEKVATKKTVNRRSSK